MTTAKKSIRKSAKKVKPRRTVVEDRFASRTI